MLTIQKIKSFPNKPGVYLFKDAKGVVLYVGKAKNLKKRVSSYFSKRRDSRPQVEFLLKRVTDIDFIITDTEKEALLLENTLIKKHRPRYNILLRDDKSYVSIRIGAEHAYPGILLTRRIRKDGALYFGPYDSGIAAREAVENITRYFRVRSCTDGEFANRVRPCLKFDIGRCTAPCIDRVSADDYAAQVEEAKFFLKGQSRELIRILDSKMRIASENLQYEEAARLRDAISMLKGLVEKQKVVKHGGGDKDIVGIAREAERVALCLLKIKNGALVGRNLFYLTDNFLDDSKVMNQFLSQHYNDQYSIPPRIIVSHLPESTGLLEEVLSEKKNGAVKIILTKKGEARRLVELAITNAKESLVKRRAPAVSEKVLDRLARKLGVAHLHTVECVDISNLQGREAVGSVVVFVNGEPEKSRYRIYNIRTLFTPDDYGMMREVLRRRYLPDQVADNKVSRRLGYPLPDLLLVDGGKGQLAVAKRVMKEAEVAVSIAAIAKAKKTHGEKKSHPDLVYIPGRKNPLGLRRDSAELLLLMRIRDEAHRFGINAHRRQKSKIFIKV